jgi:DNA-binding transcriptional ArsR family regulator
MKRQIPDEFLDLMAEKFRLLGDASRLAILRALMGGEMTVTQIVEGTGRGQANVSKHLKLLHESGLLERRKHGLQVFYKIADPLVEQLCNSVCDAVARDAAAQVEAHSRRLATFQAISKAVKPPDE